MTGENKLDQSEITRYARHIVLPEIGGAGQQRLKAARVLVIGAGGLGAPVLVYLAAAGIGRIGIVDDDAVALSNLQRQIIHRTEDIDRAKVERAAEAITSLNPHVGVDEHRLRLNADNAEALFRQYDLVIDGSDNFDTRYLAADTAAAVGIPLVTGAVGRFDGSLTVLKPYEANADGRLNPGYRDLFPSAPPPGVVPACAAPQAASRSWMKQAASRASSLRGPG